MFRRWNTILGPEGDQADNKENVERDADVIMTAAVLGFTEGRLALGHPVEFAFDPKETEDKLVPLEATVARINRALARSDKTLRATAGVAPEWEKGSVITGAPGSSRVSFDERHARLVDAEAEALRRLTADDETIGYRGRGAYTGLTHDPVTHRPGIRSTARYNLPEDGYGDRWVPPQYKYKYPYKNGKLRNQDTAPWGLLAGGQDIEEMATIPDESASSGKLVGYVHGMVQTIYDAVQKGPWCTPYEIAVGEKTTKLASCFPCTMFMYAAGFPPSKIHLGRGESWVPFYEMRPGDEPSTGVLSQLYALVTGTEPEKAPNLYTRVNIVIASVNNRWRLECRQYLDLGVDIMKRNNMASVNERHRPRLERLGEFLSDHVEDVHAGANLILDAVTVHGGESDRIGRTLRTGGRGKGKKEKED